MSRRRTVRDTVTDPTTVLVLGMLLPLVLALLALGGAR